MSAMVKRVAAALVRAGADEGRSEVLARIAVAAMMEPTDTMKAAGAQWDAEHEWIYRSMIGVALSEAFPNYPAWETPDDDDMRDCHFLDGVALFDLHNREAA
jgi:hypothetical protein